MIDGSINRDDIRAAVSANMITEAQASSLMALAQQRSGARAHMSGQDEPFELFKGFNEIFIVIGLLILYGGWQGITGLGLVFAGSPKTFTVITGLISLATTIGLATYFTRKRRMIAPSILLSILFGISSVHTLGAITLVSWSNGNGVVGALPIIAGGSALLLFGYFLAFRVPFTLAQIMLSIFVAALGLASIGETDIDHVTDIFMLSAGGPFAYITLVMGLIGLAIALKFDMSDPHRVSIRSTNAFWLHVLAAPAIVNTVALTLVSQGTLVHNLILAGFVTLVAVFAIVIDRRSFLISAVGYIVALAALVVDDSFSLIILLLGAGLVFLGAKWETIRRGIMTALPDFKGKDRLPPYDLIKETT
ncbi:MAG: hypothetical protein ACPGVK_03550 [Halocynthiibacter sp.]